MIVLCAAFAYLCFTVLAPWQLGKNSRNSDRNDLIAASLHADPIPVGQVFDGTDTAADSDEWRPVVATGNYLADEQVLVRLRSVEGDPAFEVLAPFRLDDGRVIIVDRGYVRPDQRMQPPHVDAPPAGTVSVDARVRKAEHATGERAPVDEGGWTQVYSIDPTVVGAVTGLPLLGDYLQLEGNQPGGLGVIALPQLDSGPYLSYGLQWLAFGIMAPLGAGYFAWSEVRERRLRRAQNAAFAAGPPSGGPGGAGRAPARVGTDGAQTVSQGGPPDTTAADTDSANDAGATDDEFAHVLRGRRKRRTHQPAPAPAAARVDPAELPEAQRRTLAERYSKKS